MNNVKLVLESISPVHIGSAERELAEDEFVKDGRFCYVVDDQKLAAALREWGLSQAFSKNILSQPGRFRLYDFLRGHNRLSEADLIQISGYCMEASSPQVVPRNPKPFIRDGKMIPYIPGTAVKGAIRTAIMFSMIRRDRRGIDDLTQYVEAELDRIDKSGGRKPSRWFIDRQKKWFAQWFTQGLLAPFYLTREQKRYTPQTDIMRCIKISDSLTLVDSLRLEEAMLMSILGSGAVYNKNDTVFYLECLPAKFRVEFKLGIDQSVLALFKKDKRRTVPFESLDDIIGMIDEFGEAQWEQERNYFSLVRDSNEIDLSLIREFYQADYKSALRVGWGSGLLGTTVDLLLPEDLRKRLRNMLFVDRGDDEAPKSRRLTIARSGRDVQAQLPLGWMMLG